MTGCKPAIGTDSGSDWRKPIQRGAHVNHGAAFKESLKNTTDKNDLTEALRA